MNNLKWDGVTSDTYLHKKLHGGLNAFQILQPKLNLLEIICDWLITYGKHDSSKTYSKQSAV